MSHPLRWGVLPTARIGATVVEADRGSVPRPMAMHKPWTVAASQAGKHVLCEKPSALTAAGAGRCFDVAEAAGVRCVEGLMWRHHPQTDLARRLVADGATGRPDRGAVVSAARSTRATCPS